jgi:hypothetical protein
VPVTAFAAQHPHVVGLEPPPPSKAELQDILFGARQVVLKNLLKKSPELPDAELKTTWQSALTKAMQRDQPRVPTQEVTAYMEEHILPNELWETFHDMVRNSASTASASNAAA